MVKKLRNYLITLALISAGVMQARIPSEADTIWNPEKYAQFFPKDRITFQEFLAQGGKLAPGKMIGTYSQELKPLTDEDVQLYWTLVEEITTRIYDPEYNTWTSESYAVTLNRKKGIAPETIRYAELLKQASTLDLSEVGRGKYITALTEQELANFQEFNAIVLNAMPEDAKAKFEKETEEIVADYHQTRQQEKDWNSYPERKLRGWVKGFGAGYILTAAYLNRQDIKAAVQFAALHAYIGAMRFAGSPAGKYIAEKTAALVQKAAALAQKASGIKAFSYTI